MFVVDNVIRYLFPRLSGWDKHNNVKVINKYVQVLWTWHKTGVTRAEEANVASPIVLVRPRAYSRLADSTKPYKTFRSSEKAEHRGGRKIVLGRKTIKRYEENETNGDSIRISNEKTTKNRVRPQCLSWA